ncbi:MAG: GNAT family N-acetyltransferase [Acidimicrobiia bacterium]|nr:GNAT family N-acetyltransferase [Acidimicrobiia bacterium]
MSSKLAYCEDWFRRHNLGLVFRQTPETESGVDEALNEAGFTVEGRTKVMVASLSQVVASLSKQTGDDVGAALSDEWVAAASSLWGIDESRAPAWRGILNRIDLPANYAAGYGVDGSVAVGLGVVDGDWLGVFELIVAQAVRRQGHGARLLSELTQWGSACGASRAYLQVVEDNAAAIGFYKSVGFEEAYTYWYRRLPVR